MDLILYNGQIYTMRHHEDVHSAIAISDGKIVALGGPEILSLQTQETEVINLDGKYVFPGFNDSHMHLMGYGAALMQVDLSAARSVEDVIEITQAFIAANEVKEETWVIGRGWNQDHFSHAVMPMADDLDKISNNHYIFLRRACGHVATVNSKVLEDLNLTRAYTQIDGGEYYDGIFKENALELILAQVPEPSKDDMKQWILKGVDALHRMGITAVQSDDLCVFPEHLTKQTFDALSELASVNQLKLRVYEQSLFRTYENFNNFILAGYKQNHAIGTFKYGPLKILGDGSLGGRTAWMIDAYADAETHGIHMYEQNELNDYVALAHENQVATAIHCIGDAMLSSALDAIEIAQKKHPNIHLRHGIVHCQITRPEQLQRMKDLQVMAYVQPIFLDYDLHIVEDRVGKTLASTSYAWKTMLDLGLQVAFGSDAPVETPDPIKGIHCAATRKDLKYRPPQGYLPSEKLDIYTCIHKYTAGGAFASYDEHHLGLLEKDYMADLVVIEGPIFETPLDAHVHMTIFQGNIVYRNE